MTGYGYIRRCTPVAGGGFGVAAFVEKPALALAQRYVASGVLVEQRYVLLSGQPLPARAGHTPPRLIGRLQQRKGPAQTDVDFVRADAAHFKACRADSIDFAVMEKTDAYVVGPMDASWSDVGAFAALWDVLPHHAQGNVHRWDLLAHDCHNNLVMTEYTLVATVGMHDTLLI
ncbi:hypothetical protein KI616_15280 [Hydrogenophaga taeniospiralis]|nr:hypothetical protein KI616_15280 [Hydrogenophaga taeniospiralis]